MTNEELKTIYDYLNSQTRIGGEMDIIIAKLKAEVYPVEAVYEEKEVPIVEETLMKKVSKKK